MRYTLYVSQTKDEVPSMSLKVWFSDDDKIAFLQRDINVYEKSIHNSFLRRIICSYVIWPDSKGMNGVRALEGFVDDSIKYASSRFEDVETTKLRGLLGNKKILNFIKGKKGNNTLGEILHFRLCTKVPQMDKSQRLQFTLFTHETSSMKFLVVAVTANLSKVNIKKAIIGNRDKREKVELLSYCEVPYGSKKQGKERLEAFKKIADDFSKRSFTRRRVLDYYDVSPTYVVMNHVEGYEEADDGFYSELYLGKSCLAYDSCN